MNSRIYIHTHKDTHIDFKSNSKFLATTVNLRCTIIFTPSQKRYDACYHTPTTTSNQSYKLQLTNATLTSLFSSNILMYHIHTLTLPTKTKTQENLYSSAKPIIAIAQVYCVHPSTINPLWKSTQNENNHNTHMHSQTRKSIRSSVRILQRQIDTTHDDVKEKHVAEMYHSVSKEICKDIIWRY